ERDLLDIFSSDYVPASLLQSAFLLHDGLGWTLPRALATVEHLLARAKETGRALAIRVVKGAYWDAEVKRAQELGMPGFPVYTRKWATDLSYLAIAQRLLASDAPVYPQFATHNALTVAT
ncbi:MAG: proline dehydrogenase family protein, partial [Betaproteobacteria bacterium]